MDATVFGTILGQLIEALPGARGAVFADWDGETVDQAASGDPVEMSIFAAHWGIVFFLAKARFVKLGYGAPQQLHLHFGDELVLVRAVDDSYYMAVALPSDVNLGRALHEIERTRLRLREEM